MVDDVRFRSVFQIFIDRGGRLPFFVRRESWSDYSKFLVTEITPGKRGYMITRDYPYGFAFGYYYGPYWIDGLVKLPFAGKKEWEELLSEYTDTLIMLP